MKYCCLRGWTWTVLTDRSWQVYQPCSCSLALESTKASLPLPENNTLILLNSWNSQAELPNKSNLHIWLPEITNPQSNHITNEKCTDYSRFWKCSLLFHKHSWHMCKKFTSMCVKLFFKIRINFLLNIFPQFMNCVRLWSIKKTPPSTVSTRSHRGTRHGIMLATTTTNNSAPNSSPQTSTHSLAVWVVEESCQRNTYSHSSVNHSRNEQSICSMYYSKLTETLKAPIFESCGRTTSRSPELHELQYLSFFEFSSSCETPVLVRKENQDKLNFTTNFTLNDPITKLHCEQGNILAVHTLLLSFGSS